MGGTGWGAPLTPDLYPEPWPVPLPSSQAVVLLVTILLVWWAWF